MKVMPVCPGMHVTNSVLYYSTLGRCGGLVVSVLVSGSSGLGSNPGQGHCGLGQGTSFSQCLSPPKCANGYREFNAEVNPAIDQHPIQGGVEILLVASCYRNQDKPQPDGPVGSYADFT